jgi:hypothetical protein
MQATDFHKQLDGSDGLTYILVSQLFKNFFVLQSRNQIARAKFI